MLLSLSMSTVAAVLQRCIQRSLRSGLHLLTLFYVLLTLLLICVCHCVCNSLDAFIVLSGAVLTAYVGITGLIRRMAKVRHVRFVRYSTTTTTRFNLNIAVVAEQHRCSTVCLTCRYNLVVSAFKVAAYIVCALHEPKRT
jgi:hypothetical protein